MNRPSVPIYHDDAQPGDIGAAIVGLTDTIRVFKTEIADLATRLDRLGTTERSSRDHTHERPVERRLHPIVEDIIARTHDDLCVQPLSWTVPTLHKMVAERIARANATLCGERPLAIPCIATVYKRVQAIEFDRTPYRFGAPRTDMTTDGRSRGIPRVGIVRSGGLRTRAGVARLVEDATPAPPIDVTNEGGDAAGNGETADTGRNRDDEGQDDDDEEDA
jgi:hypothetical protein